MPDTPDADRLTVLYDGACPLCRAEVGIYRDLEPKQPLGFVDVSDPDTPLPPGLPAGLRRNELLARFHVRHADGRIESGARAFIAMWERLPYWRVLAWFGRLPGMTAVMELAYRGFLRIRPALQRRLRARR